MSEPKFVNKVERIVDGKPILFVSTIVDDSREFYAVAESREVAELQFQTSYPAYGVQMQPETADGVAVTPLFKHIPLHLIAPDVNGIITARNALALVKIYPAAIFTIEQLLEDLHF